MQLSRCAFYFLAGLVPLSAVSCVAVDCHTENASDVFFRSVPAAAGYVPSGDVTEPAPGGRLRTQTYSLDDDGTFTFYRSLETEVGHLGVEVGVVGRKKAKESGIEPFEGVQIRSLNGRGPAAAAGLRSGDIIVSFDGKEGLSAERFQYLVESCQPGQKVSVGVQREREALQVLVVLGAQKQIESGKVFQQDLLVLNDWDRTGLKLVELTDEVRPIVLEPGVTQGGLLVRDVLPGGPAFHAGVKVRDVITHVVTSGGQLPLDTVAAFERAMGTLVSGDTATFTVWRAGAATPAAVELESNAASDGGMSIPVVFEYKHKPQRRQVAVLLGLLYNYERCYAVRERRGEPENFSSMGWGALVNLIAYSSNSRGKGRLQLLWLIPIWWGDD